MPMKFFCSVRTDGVRIEARRRSLMRNVLLPVDDWSKNATSEQAAVRVLLSESVRSDGTSVVIDHTTAARLPGSIADTINLPPLSKWHATLGFDGRIDSPDGAVRIQWSDARNRPVTVKRTGAFVTAADETTRLTAAVFRLVAAIDAFNDTAGSSAEARVPAWHAVQEALG
ncbi:MAG: hypothetical protein ABWY18_02805, partial [Tardiphaga sp.]